MDKGWDVIATQSFVYNEPLSEIEESALRSKAILIIAKRNWSSKAWNRVMKRFINCVNKLGE